MLQVGIINVPIYPTISEREYEHIFNEAEIKMAFVADQGLCDKILAIKDRCLIFKKFLPLRKMSMDANIGRPF